MVLDTKAYCDSNDFKDIMILSDAESARSYEENFIYSSNDGVLANKIETAVRESIDKINREYQEKIDRERKEAEQRNLQFRRNQYELLKREFG